MVVRPPDDEERRAESSAANSEAVCWEERERRRRASSGLGASRAETRSGGGALIGDMVMDVMSYELFAKMGMKDESK